MAARNPRPARAARPARSTTSKKPAAAARTKEADAPAEEGGGIGWEGGIGIITFIVAVAALLMIDADIAKYPGESFFFGK